MRDHTVVEDTVIRLQLPALSSSPTTFARLDEKKREDGTPAGRRLLRRTPQKYCESPLFFLPFPGFDQRRLARTKRRSDRGKGTMEILVDMGEGCQV